jgi:flagellin-like hook-associated protein FlgL
MPIVVNSNASATEASFNLSRNNEALRKSLGRLSSGKRISNPADDAGGLAVAYKLNSTINRSYATIQNAQNALSYLQVQDSALATTGKILDRMAELRTMAQDITKNSGDIENYSKEFVELQSQLRQNQGREVQWNQSVCDNRAELPQVRKLSFPQTQMVLMLTLMAQPKPTANSVVN